MQSSSAAALHGRPPAKPLAGMLAGRPDCPTCTPYLPKLGLSHALLRIGRVHMVGSSVNLPDMSANLAAKVAGGAAPSATGNQRVHRRLLHIAMIFGTLPLRPPCSHACLAPPAAQHWRRSSQTRALPLPKRLTLSYTPGPCDFTAVSQVQQPNLCRPAALATENFLFIPPFFCHSVGGAAVGPAPAGRSL